MELLGSRAVMVARAGHRWRGAQARVEQRGGQAKGPGPCGADRGSDDQLRPSTAFFKASLPTTSSLTLTDVLVM